MNIPMIRYTLSQVLRIEGDFLLLPCIVSLVYQANVGITYFIIALVLMLTGTAGSFVKPKDPVIYLKEGCVATSLSWILMSVAGCLPFFLTGEIPHFTDALFETVSGFTTTGASILSNVEGMSHTGLFWRSFTHWLGGMGVLVFLLAVIPMSGGSNINLMRAESPGPSVGKLVPKIKHTARILYLIYLVMTLIETILLIAGGMSVFDSLALSFGTAGTGGFGVKNDSFASYTPYVQWVAGIFMLLFGVNFNAYYYMLLRQFKRAFGIEEVRKYIMIILLSTGVIFVNIIKMYDNAFTALTHAFFQVTSIISTTGFGSTDFDQWPTMSKLILIFLMFIGACRQYGRRYQGIEDHYPYKIHSKGILFLYPSQDSPKDYDGRQSRRTRRRTLDQRVLHYIHDSPPAVHVPGNCRRSRPRHVVYRRTGNLEQHRSRSGEGRPHM